MEYEEIIFLEWLKPALELLKIGVEKLFPTAEERRLSRKEKAKENWDKFENETKEFLKDLDEREDRNTR